MQGLHQTHPIVNPLVKATIPERLVTPFVLFAKYLALTAWPKLLVADYSAPSLMPTANPFNPLALSGIVIAGLIVWGMIRFWKKQPQVVLTLGLFICAYGLIANLLLRIGTIFGERLFYWPSVFVLMLVAYAAVQAYRRLEGLSWRRAGRVAIGCMAAVAAALMCVRTVTRNTDWAGNIPLSIASARDNLGSAKTCYWAGMTMVTDGPEPWMKEFGAGLLKRAVMLYPGFGDSYFELAKYYGRKQELATSLYYLGKAAENEPGSQPVRFAIGSVERDLASRQQESYMPELEACEKEHDNDGASEFVVALAYVGQKKWDLAKEQCEKILKKEPHFHETGALLATIEHETGHGEEAVVTLRTYVMNVPFALDARCQLAQYLMEEDGAKHPHALDEAGMNLDKAAQLGDVPAIRNLRGQLSRKRASAREKEEAGRMASAGERVRP
jgi:tetratricopeptide (TPR) repeat protein